MGRTGPRTGGLGHIRKIADPEPVSNLIQQAAKDCVLEVEPNNPFLPLVTCCQNVYHSDIKEAEHEHQGLRNKNLIL